jgi:preprotein translocase subunit SecY
MQLLSVGIPALERLSKQGEEGHKKIAQYTRYVTILLAIIQSIGIIVSFAANKGTIHENIFSSNPTVNNWIFGICMTIAYTAGALIVMWIGERITDYGVGNGQSMIIFVGILSTAGLTIRSKVQSLFDSAFRAETYGADVMATDIMWELIFFILVTAVIFFAIVYVDLSERKVPVQYAKQIKGRKMYGGQSSSIPIRISGGGVMPLIFAFSILSFPQMVGSMINGGNNAFVEWWNNWMSASAPEWYQKLIYATVLCVLIFAFSFFYAQMQFNPEDISKSIQQNGGFIQGIRPGKATEAYLKKISNRITLFGAIYLSLVAFIPTVAFAGVDYTLVNVFSTTGILIIVSCAMEFEKQLQAQLMMKNYKGFLK